MQVIPYLVEWLFRIDILMVQIKWHSQIRSVGIIDYVHTEKEEKGKL